MENVKLLSEGSSAENDHSLMFGKQWKEVTLRTDIASWLCAAYIPEVHRWIFGTGGGAESKIIYSDNLETYTVAITFDGSGATTACEQVKALIVHRWVLEDETIKVRVLAGLAKRIGGTYGKAEIWKSDDYGETWSKVIDLSSFGPPYSDNTFRINEFLELNDGSLLAFTGGDACKIYKSTNHGDTWAEFTIKQGVQQIFAADYDPTDGTYGCIGMGAITGGFYYSKDGGATINDGYVDDGGFNGQEQRVTGEGCHAVAYDPDSENWFLNIAQTSPDPPGGRLFRVARADIDDWKKYTDVKNYKYTTGDVSAALLKLHYVRPWGRMFAFVCHNESVDGTADYTEVWSWTDGLGQTQSIEWDSYTPRKLITTYGRESIRELCAHAYDDGMFVMGAAENKDYGIRLFVKTAHIKPILSFYPRDMYPDDSANPPVGLMDRFPVRAFDADANEIVRIALALYPFDLSKDIRIRLVYAMALDKGAGGTDVRIRIAHTVVKLDSDATPGETGAVAKNITVSDTLQILQQYDQFSIPASDLDRHSNHVAVEVKREGSAGGDTRLGDWLLVAIHFFQDV